jgi:hypothetical protein
MPISLWPHAEVRCDAILQFTVITNDITYALWLTIALTLVVSLKSSGMYGKLKNESGLGTVTVLCPVAVTVNSLS